MGLHVSISGVTTDGGGHLVIATSVILDTSSIQDLAVALANTALPEAVYGSTLVTSGGSPVNLGDVIYSALLAYVPEGNTNGTSFNSTGLSHTTSLLQRTGNRELSFESERLCPAGTHFATGFVHSHLTLLKVGMLRCRCASCSRCADMQECLPEGDCHDTDRRCST